MDITLVIEIGIALTALLAMLIFLFFSLQKKKKVISSKEKTPVQDLNSLIKIIKNSIHGVDKSGNALKVDVFSLYLSVCDNLTPKMTWEKLTFEVFIERNFIENAFFNIFLLIFFSFLFFPFSSTLLFSTLSLPDALPISSISSLVCNISFLIGP